ncbi:MAG: hypothetical protein KatS3mg131_3010 [Candidatus Tectimicrobiota bacterium]|nr:MAG: hypothetical protein KatS3mg131_3010 [Candidatus Tectomicrobia bacterium]
MTFAKPQALLLLVAVALLWLPRRQPRVVLAFNLLEAMPPLRRRWLRHLPFFLLTAVLVLLIVLAAEPTGGSQELYTVQEARNILLLIDTSASMEGAPIRTVKAVAEAFIRRRPPDDRIGIVLFSDVASGGILTRNHRGLIKELRRQEGIGISGTQLGLGLLKCLASFIEDEVETVLWRDRTLSMAQREQRFQHALAETARLARHLRHRQPGPFTLHLPEIPDPRQLGRGKVLIILSDAKVQLAPAAEYIDHVQVLHLFEQWGFEHLYFISVDALPEHLQPLFQRHPFWRFFRLRSLTDAAQLAQVYAEIDRLERTPSRVEGRLVPRPLFLYGLPGLLLVPLALLLQRWPPFRSEG